LLSQINLRQYFHSDAQMAVAGGINPTSAASLLQMKADVAIIGSAITKSADVAKASAEFQDLFMSRGNV
jgi:3-hexulose-6-phosphate synthase